MNLKMLGGVISAAFSLALFGAAVAQVPTVIGPNGVTRIPAQPVFVVGSGGVVSSPTTDSFGSTAVLVKDAGGAPVDYTAPAPVLLAPSGSSSYAIAPSATSAVAASLVAKASAGNLYAWRVTTGASGGYVLIADAPSAQGNGAITPKDCVAVGANASVGGQLDVPERFSTGITLLFSTTGCFTFTGSATAYIRADVQ